jgi:hypothetical protein
MLDKDIKRFWGKVSIKGNERCWEWTASRYPFGYGQFWLNRTQVLAHRISWIIKNGPIENGLFVCHHCDNASCVNPSHLFLGNHTDNMRDMLNKGRNFYKNKTHCPKGHEYAPDNIYLRSKKHRICKICNDARSAKNRKKQRIGYDYKDNSHKTHCKRGHPFSGDNLYINKERKRICRKCSCEKVKRYYQLKKQINNQEKSL